MLGRDFTASLCRMNIQKQSHGDSGVFRGFQTPVYRLARLNYVPKLKKTVAKQHQLFNHIFNANASTPSQTPFNLKSNVLEIVELKTLSIPVPATQFCLNVSQSIVCQKKSSLYIVPVCPNLSGIAQRSSVKKLFLKILKIHRKTPVPESLF